MGVEHTIYCDGCSSIHVSVSTVTKARREGKRNGLVHRFNDKDLCPQCYKSYRDGVERLTSTQKGNKVAKNTSG